MAASQAARKIHPRDFHSGALRIGCARDREAPEILRGDHRDAIDATRSMSVHGGHRLFYPAFALTNEPSFGKTERQEPPASNSTTRGTTSPFPATKAAPSDEPG